MKKNNIIFNLTERKEKTKASIIPLFINCIISIFSLCFSVNIFFYFHTFIKDVLLEKFLFVIMSGLALTFIAALRFSFYSFIKSLAEKYKLLLILGIKSRDFWQLAIKEYFSMVFFMGFKVILICNVICSTISCVLFYNSSNFNILIVGKQFALTVIIVFILYVILLLLTMIVIIYYRQKRSLIDFFEQYTQDLSKGHKNRYGHLWMPIFGFTLLFFSFLLLINFKVEKMIVAIFLNMIGAFLVIHSDGYLIKKLMKKIKHVYYKKILIWTDLIYQYKINSYIIFILYTLNFFLVYFMGGLFVSVNSGQDMTTKYPYEIIVYGDSNSSLHNDYQILSVNVDGYGAATALSNNDFNTIMKTDIELKEGEILFFDQREKGSNVPITEQEISIISKEKNEKYLSYRVKKAEWKVIFGQNILQELNGIIIFNNKDFKLLESAAGMKKFIFISEQSVDISDLQIGNETVYWNRTQQIEKEHFENKLLIVLIYMISLILILQSQAFIFTKQIVNLKEECYRYDVLKQLGIKSKDLAEIIEKKITGILIIPGVLAIINGIIFFVMDIGQEPGGFTLPLLLNYGVVIMVFIFIQILGCYFINQRVKKIYMNRV